MKDPIVEEVRKHRKEHTRKFHGKLSEICVDLRRVQETSGHDVVRLAPRRLEPITLKKAISHRAHPEVG